MNTLYIRETMVSGNYIIYIINDKGWKQLKKTSKQFIFDNPDLISWDEVVSCCNNGIDRNKWDVLLEKEVFIEML